MQQGHFTDAVFEEELRGNGGQEIVDVYSDPRVRVMNEARMWEPPDGLRITHEMQHQARNNQLTRSILRISMMGHKVPVSEIMMAFHPKLYHHFREICENARGGPRSAYIPPVDDDTATLARMIARDMLTYNLDESVMSEFDQYRLWGRVVVHQPRKSALQAGADTVQFAWNFDPTSLRPEVRQEIERIRQDARDETESRLRQEFREAGQEPGQQATEQHFLQAQEVGYEQGYRDGLNNGRQQGYDEGHNVGYLEGFRKAEKRRRQGQHILPDVDESEEEIMSEPEPGPSGTQVDTPKRKPLPDTPLYDSDESDEEALKKAQELAGERKAEELLVREAERLGYSVDEYMEYARRCADELRSKTGEQPLETEVMHVESQDSAASATSSRKDKGKGKKSKPAPAQEAASDQMDTETPEPTSSYDPVAELRKSIREKAGTKPATPTSKLHAAKKPRSRTEEERQEMEKTMAKVKAVRDKYESKLKRYDPNPSWQKPPPIPKPTPEVPPPPIRHPPRRIVLPGGGNTLGGVDVIVQTDIPGGKRTLDIPAGTPIAYILDNPGRYGLQVLRDKESRVYAIKPIESDIEVIQVEDDEIKPDEPPKKSPSKRRRARRAKPEAGRRYYRASIPPEFKHMEVSLVSVNKEDAPSARGYSECPDAAKCRLIFPRGFKDCYPTSECHEDLCLAADPGFWFREYEDWRAPMFHTKTIEQAELDATMKDGAYTLEPKMSHARQVINYAKSGPAWDADDGPERKLRDHGFFNCIENVGFFILDIEGWTETKRAKMLPRLDMTPSEFEEVAFAIITIGAPNGVILNIQVNYNGQEVLGVELPDIIKMYLESTKLRRGMYGHYDDYIKLTNGYLPKLVVGSDLSNLIISMFPQPWKLTQENGAKKMSYGKHYAADNLKSPVMFYYKEKDKSSTTGVKNIYIDYQTLDFSRKLPWPKYYDYYQAFDVMIALAALDLASARILKNEGCKPWGDVIRVQHEILDRIEGFPPRPACSGQIPDDLIIPYPDYDWVEAGGRADVPVKQMKIDQVYDPLDKPNMFASIKYIVNKKRICGRYDSETNLGRRYELDGSHLSDQQRLAYERQLGARLGPPSIEHVTNDMLDPMTLRDKWHNNPERVSLPKKFRGKSKMNDFPHPCIHCSDFNHSSEECAAVDLKCPYPFCLRPQGHIIPVCPVVHNYCQRCDSHGHLTSDHSTTSSYHRQEEFRIAKYLGVRTCRLYDHKTAYQSQRDDQGRYRLEPKGYMIPVEKRVEKLLKYPASEAEYEANLLPVPTSPKRKADEPIPAKRAKTTEPTVTEPTTAAGSLAVQEPVAENLELLEHEEDDPPEDDEAVSCTGPEADELLSEELDLEKPSGHEDDKT